MRFVLDASVTLFWLLDDGKPSSKRYAQAASYLELALRAGLPIATLDDDLANAARRAGVKRFRGA